MPLRQLDLRREAHDLWLHLWVVPCPCLTPSTVHHASGDGPM